MVIIIESKKKDEKKRVPHFSAVLHLHLLNRTTEVGSQKHNLKTSCLSGTSAVENWSTALRSPGMTGVWWLFLLFFLYNPYNLTQC